MMAREVAKSANVFLHILSLFLPPLLPGTVLGMMPLALTGVTLVVFDSTNLANLHRFVFSLWSPLETGCHC